MTRVGTDYGLSGKRMGKEYREILRYSRRLDWSAGFMVLFPNSAPVVTSGFRWELQSGPHRRAPFVDSAAVLVPVAR